jgi:hypothetical protein
MEWGTTRSECFWYQPHGGYAGIGLSVVGGSTGDVKVLLYLYLLYLSCGEQSAAKAKRPSSVRYALGGLCERSATWEGVGARQSEPLGSHKTSHAARGSSTTQKTKRGAPLVNSSPMR